MGNKEINLKGLQFENGDIIIAKSPNDSFMGKGFIYYVKVKNINGCVKIYTEGEMIEIYDFNDNE